MARYDFNRTENLVIAGVLALLMLCLYAGAYAWRRQDAVTAPFENLSDPSSLDYLWRPKFSTAFEDTLFIPALWVHEHLHPSTFLPQKWSPPYYQVLDSDELINLPDLPKR